MQVIDKIILIVLNVFHFVHIHYGLDGTNKNIDEFQEKLLGKGINPGGQNPPDNNYRYIKILNQLQKIKGIVIGQVQKSKSSIIKQTKNSKNALVTQIQKGRNLTINQIKNSKNSLLKQVQASRNRTINQVKAAKTLTVNQIKASRSLLIKQIQASKVLTVNQIRNTNISITKQINNSTTNLQNILLSLKNSQLHNISNSLNYLINKTHQPSNQQDSQYKYSSDSQIKQLSKQLKQQSRIINEMIQKQSRKQQIHWRQYIQLKFNQFSGADDNDDGSDDGEGWNEEDMDSQEGGVNNYQGNYQSSTGNSWANQDWIQNSSEYQQSQKTQQRKQEIINAPAKSSSSFENANQEQLITESNLCNIDDIYDSIDISSYLSVMPHSDSYVLDLSQIFSHSSSQQEDRLCSSAMVSLIKRNNLHKKPIIPQASPQDKENKLTLSKIDLSSNELSSRDVQQLFDIFQYPMISPSEVKQLDLSNNYLTNLSFLYNNKKKSSIYPSLLELRLQNNQLLTFEQFSKLSKISFKYLRRLYISQESFLGNAGNSGNAGNEGNDWNVGKQQQNNKQFDLKDRRKILLELYKQPISNIKDNWPSFNQLIIYKLDDNCQQPGYQEYTQIKSNIEKQAWIGSKINKSNKAENHDRRYKQKQDKSDKQSSQKGTKNQKRKPSASHSDQQESEDPYQNKFMIVWI